MGPSFQHRRTYRLDSFRFGVRGVRRASGMAPQADSHVKFHRPSFLEVPILIGHLHILSHNGGFCDFAPVQASKSDAKIWS